MLKRFRFRPNSRAEIAIPTATRQCVIAIPAILSPPHLRAAFLLQGFDEHPSVEFSTPAGAVFSFRVRASGRDRRDGAFVFDVAALGGISIDEPLQLSLIKLLQGEVA